MKERPILFNSDMVRAVRRTENPKTQTRRVVKPQPEKSAVVDSKGRMPIAAWVDGDRWLKCPYGSIGDRLWVRETFQPYFSPGWERKHPDYKTGSGYQISYLATDGIIDIEDVYEESMSSACKPSIHMPRWASRITLEITDIGAERLQDITEEDAKAEGIQVLPLQDPNDPSAWWQSAPGKHQARKARESFHLLWDSINAKRGFGWDVNPWVWVIEFRRLENA